MPSLEPWPKVMESPRGRMRRSSLGGDGGGFGGVLLLLSLLLVGLSARCEIEAAVVYDGTGRIC